MQPSPARDVNIQRTESLISPVSLVNEMPLTPELEATVLDGRQQIEKVLCGDDPRFMVITGPCSIHDEAAAIDYAGRLLKLSEELNDRLLLVMRVYFEKPRTTVGWKGLIYDPHLNDTFDIDEGLRRARSILMRVVVIRHGYDIWQAVLNEANMGDAALGQNLRCLVGN